MKITLKGKISAALLAGLISIMVVSYFVINMVLNKNLEQYIRNDMKGIIAYSRESCASLVQLDNRKDAWMTLSKINKLFNVYIKWGSDSAGNAIFDNDVELYSETDSGKISLLKLSSGEEIFATTLLYPMYVDNEYEGNLIIQKDYSEMFISNRNVLKAVLGSEAILIAVLFIVIYLITSKSTKPLKKLTIAMETLGKGEEVKDLKVINKDDISIITYGFNDMKNNIVEMQNNTKEFFNNATHELKTPLTAIRGYSQMLQDEEFKDEFIIRAVERIEEESIKMNKLVEKLLMISREEAMVKAYAEDIDINKEVKRIVEAFNNNISTRRVEVNIREKSSVKVHAIKDDVESLLTNLIENSLKYSDGKIIDIEISDVFKISNEVSYIHEEIKNRLFEPFIKGNFNSSEISSSGLGLYICKRICEKNGFDIRYNIEEGIIEFEIHF